MPKGVVALIALALAFSSSARAAEPLLVSRPGQLPVGTKETQLAFVQGGAAVLLNVRALLRDMPELRALVPRYPHIATADRQRLAEWAVAEGSFLSLPQEALVGVRTTAIPYDHTNVVTAWRPFFWGRAALKHAHFQGRTIGMLDLKGSGLAEDDAVYLQQLRSLRESREPHAELLARLRGMPNSSGVMDLAEALREASRQEATQLAFEMDNLPYETVETYFVLVLPVRVWKADGSSVPIAIYARQPHAGRLAVGARVRQGIEGVLRPEVARSTGAIQRSSSGAIVDFGATYVVSPHFPGFAELDGMERQGATLLGWGRAEAESAARGDMSPARALYAQLTRSPKDFVRREVPVPWDPVHVTTRVEKALRKRHEPDRVEEKLERLFRSGTMPEAAWLRYFGRTLTVFNQEAATLAEFRQLLRWCDTNRGPLDGAQIEVLASRIDPSNWRKIVQLLTRDDVLRFLQILDRNEITEFALEDFLVPLVRRFRNDPTIVSLATRRLALAYELSSAKIDDLPVLRTIVRGFALTADATPSTRFFLLHPDAVTQLFTLARDKDEAVAEGARRTIRELVHDPTTFLRLPLSVRTGFLRRVRHRSNELGCAAYLERVDALLDGTDSSSH